MKRISFIAMLVLFVSNGFAMQAPVEKRIYTANKINPHPPVIDGMLNDEIWKKNEWAGNFTQWEPNEGKEPSQNTEFKIYYDDKNLYIAIRAYDTEPGKIVKRVTRRDGFDGDWVEINIDSYFDHRTAFSFTLTAAGVKGDEAISNDGNNWDSNWNPVWYAGVSQDDKGWSAEMRIPFSQLRFADKEEHIWGLQVQRRYFREEERSLWQFIPRKSSGWVSYFGELHGIKGIKPSRRIELLPYSVSNVNRFQKEAGNPFRDGQNSRISGGLDGKIGITSDFTVDFTVNPDFGQVEADPSELNLSAFETFFSEKRPFFIEGQNIFNFRLMGGDGGFSNDRLFYSRRIGRSPRYNPVVGANEFLDMPRSTSIETAVKLTGKTQGGLSIGIMDAVTGQENATIDLNGQRREVAVEPLTNYFVGRVQKDYNDGNTAIGGMITATNRDIKTENLNFLNKAAYSGGIDFRHQWKDKTYKFELKGSFSTVQGDEEAILNLQESSARYFQRPDADYVSVDPSRTSLSGHGGYVNFSKGGNNSIRYSVGGMWRSPGLELNDVGFMRQADRILQYTWAGYRVTEPFSIFRFMNINVNQWLGRNFGGETVFTGGNINGGGQFKNYWSLWFGIGREGHNLSTSALRGGPAMKFPSQWNQWYNLSTDRRKSISFSVGGSNGWQDEGDSGYHNFRFSMLFRPHNSISVSVNPFYNIRKSDLQYLDTNSMDGQNRYLFGRIDQKTLGITLRLNYSITPNLSIQYYGQPFVSAGEYSKFKRITAPRADNYEDRFHTFAGDEIGFNSAADQYEIDENLDGTVDYTIGQPDFNFRQLRSNLVVRWEYSPGSTVFFVWSQSRTGFESNGAFSFKNDLEDLFNVYPDNVFLIKVNRWLSL